MINNDQVLNVLVDFFKSANVIDPNLTDVNEIAKIKLNDLKFFKNKPDQDPTLKFEDLYTGMIDKLGELFTDPDQPPTTSPNDYTVFDKVSTFADLAGNILDCT